MMIRHYAHELLIMWVITDDSIANKLLVYKFSLGLLTLMKYKVAITGNFQYTRKFWILGCWNKLALFRNAGVFGIKSTPI